MSSALKIADWILCNFIRTTEIPRLDIEYLYPIHMGPTLHLSFISALRPLFENYIIVLQLFIALLCFYGFRLSDVVYKYSVINSTLFALA